MNNMQLRKRLVCAALLLGSLTSNSAFSASVDVDTDDLLSLSLEELLSVEITSAARKSQSLSETSAAVFVISNEDIRRSGVRSVPEALRMAPGLQVAQIDANKWAISSRGFNGRFSNKLLVLVDGRTVFTPSFSGVYWDAQDTLLEDVDRIEVIRGPGGSVWGSNAVNGVINIITKSADDTLGKFATASYSSDSSHGGAIRYGGRTKRRYKLSCIRKI